MVLRQKSFLIQRLSSFKNHHHLLMVLFFFSPSRRHCSADLRPRGACQPAPTSRQTRIQWKLKAACSFPPSLSQRCEEKGVPPAPALSEFSPPPLFLRETPPFVILRSITADKKHGIKTSIAWHDSILF